MDAERSRTYRGVGLDERRAERSRRFKAAVVDIVVSDGWSAATVRNVATAAGVGPRFFYESFVDMNDLVVAAYDEISGQLLGDAVAAVETAPADLRARAHAAVAAMVDAIAADPRKGRFLLSDAPPVVGRRRAFIRDVTDKLVEQTAEIGPGIDRREAEICALAAMASATELVRGWLDDTLSIDPSEIAAIVAGTLVNLMTEMRDGTVVLPQSGVADPG